LAPLPLGEFLFGMAPDQEYRDQDEVQTGLHGGAIRDVRPEVSS
jgi:hypothetical protein